MLNKVDSINFQGKFTTPMQGRNGILKDVTLAFERKTKGLQGSLELAKGDKVLLLKYNDRNVPFHLSNYGDLTGANLKEKTPEAIDNIAESFAKFFRILKAQTSYEKVLKKLNRSRSKAESALSANQKSYQQALLEGNEKFNNMFKSMINKNQTKLQEIENAKQKATIRYSNFINNIAGDDTRALQYVNNIINA